MKKTVLIIIIILLAIAAALLLSRHHVINIVQTKKSETKTLSTEYLQGTVAQRGGDIDGAIEHFENAIRIDPENKSLVKRLYGLYLFKGKYKEAITQAERQQEIDAENKTPPEERDAIAYLILALDNFNKKETKANEALLEPLILKMPNTHLDGAVLPMILAWSYAVDENYQAAFKVIDKIPTDYMLSVFSFNRSIINDLANNKEVKVNGKNYNPNDKAKKFLSDIFMEIGQFSIQNMNLEEAVVYFRLARMIDSDSYKLKKILALSYEAMGRFKEAIEVYNEVPESSDNYGETLVNLSLIYHRTGDDAKAMKILSKLKTIKGFEYKALFAMGAIKMSGEQFAEAIKYFEMAEKKLPDDVAEKWNLNFNLGVAYDSTNNWQKAEEHLKKAVEIAPQNPESLNYLAYGWLIRNKNIKQARTMLEAAVVGSKGAPHILDSYGWALYKTGNYNEAVPFLEKAAVGMSFSAVINDHLGDAYWKAGRQREAKFQWRKALDVFDADKSVMPEVSKEELRNKIDAGLK